MFYFQLTFSALQFLQFCTLCCLPGCLWLPSQAAQEFQRDSISAEMSRCCGSFTSHLGNHRATPFSRVLNFPECPVNGIIHYAAFESSYVYSIMQLRFSYILSYFIWEAERESPRACDGLIAPICLLALQTPAEARGRPGWSRSQALGTDRPRVWQGPNCLSHNHCFFRVSINKRRETGAELGLKPRPCGVGWGLHGKVKCVPLAMFSRYP